MAARFLQRPHRIELLLFSLPWPIERIVVFKSREVRTMPVGYRLTDAVRGIPPDPKEVEWVTGDTNLINMTMTLKYAVSDPVEYLVRVGPVDADFLVRRAAESVLTELVATMPVDDLLTSGKALIQEQTRMLNRPTATSATCCRAHA